ncbi:phosphoenolpyruvate carboxylase [Flavobacteriaceae bacterium UJ101]|nr:phosphoenolpyruvate carboxylase [Flavobacteriaceae bacterium UJ101]
MATNPKIQRYNESVVSKYQIYNSILTTLPFHRVHKTGVMLPLLHELCEEGFKNKENPTDIINRFFDTYYNGISEKERIDILFRFIQFIERQVVLFDAVEEASFDIVNNMEGYGSMRMTKEDAESKNTQEELQAFLEDFKVRIVLTAHPTQFYPGPVLGIINDLADEVKKDDILTIKKLLAQLGKTPFFKKKKPTPYDEAVSIMWYLENVFYDTFGEIYHYIEQNIYKGKPIDNSIIDLGFWPGGDRDGNPFVTPEITEDVGKKLYQSIIHCYYNSIKALKRRLTFVGIYDRIVALERKLYDNTIKPYHDESFTLTSFLGELEAIRAELIEKHRSLFVEQLDLLICQVKLFGFHFASLDIRQDSRVHHKAFVSIVDELKKEGIALLPENFEELSEKEQLVVLGDIKGKIDPKLFEDEMARKTIQSIYAMQNIQKHNGERGCNRYIISNNQTAVNVMETFAMLNLTNWEKLTVDIIPLFETVDDLQGADKVMELLYTNPAYAAHLKSRGNKQTIMLGFSDGTKDGGYFMANWGIYRAKENLTAMARKYDIEVVFFDGRGGPPARGGGQTHRFYSSLGPTIENKEIQLTIQGQTISSNFGSDKAAQFNMEHLISAGVRGKLYNTQKSLLSEEERDIIETLANVSYEAYNNFKAHPKFLPYLEEMSTLKYYAKTNIGSRPSKRGNNSELKFSDLRAIPFVGSWSQLKQNVPGFYGVGTALKKYEDAGEFEKVQKLYRSSRFFKTLIGNSMMSLSKSFFDLTAYMQNDPEFGDFWTIIHDEYLLTQRLILKLAGYEVLMQNNPTGKSSIDVRESIVLPLLTIQQFALKKVRDIQLENENDSMLEVYEKIVTRSLFGNINASRNSA